MIRAGSSVAKRVAFSLTPSGTPSSVRRGVYDVAGCCHISSALVGCTFRWQSSSVPHGGSDSDGKDTQTTTTTTPPKPQPTAEQAPKASEASQCTTGHHEKGQQGDASTGHTSTDEHGIPQSTSSSTTTDGSSSSSSLSTDKSNQQLTTPEPEPDRWVQAPYQDPDLQPIVDEKGQYIVSKGNWPTGDVAYQTPPPPDPLAPRFGYNVLQVKKDVSWWKHYHKFPRFSFAYLNIQFFFLIGLAWVVTFLSTEYRRMTDELKTPGAMVGEHRGKGPVTKGTQKVTFTSDEMGSLLGHAQGNWMDAKGESNYIGSKEYRMKQISRPKEFSMDDFRKR